MHVIDDTVYYLVKTQARCQHCGDLIKPYVEYYEITTGVVTSAINLNGREQFLVSTSNVYIPGENLFKSVEVAKSAARGINR